MERRMTRQRRLILDADTLRRASAARQRRPDRFEAARGKADIRWRTDELMALLRADDDE